MRPSTFAAFVASLVLASACTPRVKRDDQRTPQSPDQRNDDLTRLTAKDGATAALRLLETTDLHVSMEAFDYYKNGTTQDSGLVRTAALLRKARAEVPNSLTFDNGDLIQGSPLGDWFQKSRDPKTELHTVYKAMQLIGYDAANIGNHEFNFGVDFLEATLNNSKLEYVNSNVRRVDNGLNFVKPYVILDRTITLDDGTTEAIKVGVIGFAPPQVTSWDRSNLAGRLTAGDIVDAANEFVPKMRAEGADVVVAIPHSGISAAARAGNDENAVTYLTQIEGIDAVLSGHSHAVFPSPGYANIPGADIEKGTINGVPVVMAGFWGSHVGIVDLALKKADGRWQVAGGTGTTRAIKDLANLAKDEVAEDVRAAVKVDHEATLAYLQTPVGSTAAPIHSYFSQIAPSSAVQMVHDAQLWFARQAIEAGGDATAALKGLPLLSASAPLKAGMSPDNYTDVAPGQLTLRNVADLYVYPNTVRVVKITGATVADWLEKSAGMFNQIVPNDATEQFLTRDGTKTSFPAYNFDTLAGVEYEIDVTQPARFNADGTVNDATAHRIVNLKYAGVPVDPAASFLVVTNNYRADGGGKFPGLDGTKTVLDPGRESREALRLYVESLGGVVAVRDPANWRILPVTGATNVVFRTGPAAADKLGDLSGLLEAAGTDTSGFAKFRLKW